MPSEAPVPQANMVNYSETSYRGRGRGRGRGRVYGWGRGRGRGRGRDRVMGQQRQYDDRVCHYCGK